MGNVHQAIADKLRPLGGILRCTVCGTERGLGDIAEALTEGWPKCCGYTMHWITARQLSRTTEEEEG